MSTKRIRAIVGVLFVALAATLVIAVVGNGGDTAKAAGVDRAFTADMVPHHKSAVEMAAIAKERSSRDEIQALADDIIRTQNDEVAQMQAIDKRLAAAGKSKGELGADSAMMGMDMDADALRTAEPFDRAFIDMMIPHHQGAIQMARLELKDGTDAETARLAKAVIAAQSKEITQMNAWRTEWYGAVSPAGGVPKEGESMDHSTMDMG